ncbi:MAG: WD40 repeat domain-containing protein [Sphingobacteriales bacterium JAD_PAG50586_3]|nr:MAG: WD40 repeat domain-containing protein [Sphingobacteriales bacterium JAD_PAG50586_3]
MHMYSGGSDGLAVEWDLTTMAAGKVVAKVEGVIYCITPIGERFIAIGTDKGGIHIINLELKQEIKYLLNHANGVFDILYLPKHQKFIALGGDGSFSVWDSQTYVC